MYGCQEHVGSVVELERHLRRAHSSPESSALACPVQTCAWGGDTDSALVLHLTAAHPGRFSTMGSAPLPTRASSRPRPPPPPALLPPTPQPPGLAPVMCPVCGLPMHTSVVALRLCWGGHLASKGSGTRSSLVQLAMREASDADERVGLLVAAADALNLHGCASLSVSSREARARAQAFVWLPLKYACFHPQWRLTGHASKPARRRNDARGGAPRGSGCPGKCT